MQMSNSFLHNMKNWGLIFLFLLICSCNFEAQQEKEVEKLVKSELERISFNQVDQHPYFPNCNEYEEQDNLDCFYQEFKKHLISELDLSSLQIEEHTQLSLIISVNSNGKISLKECQSTNLNNSEIESVFQTQIQKMPQLFPAQKRGVLVSSEYQIPVQLTPTN